MTTLRQTPLDDDLAGALDVLAAAVERAHDDACTRTVLAAAVQRLEDTAGARLGDTSGDPFVVLQRRFGRAHARLSARPAADLDAELLQSLAGVLQAEPAGAGDRPEVRRTSAAALARC